MGNHPDGAFGGKAIDGHLRNLVADETEFRDRSPELLARLRLPGRMGNQGFHAADCPAAETGAAIVQYGHGHLEPLALGIEHIAGRNPYVGKTHGGRRGSADSHLILVLPMAHAGPCRLDHERRDLACGR